MGASQRKEAVDYFSALATAAEVPSDESFHERLRYFQRGICSGCELRNVALPIVRALIANNAQTGRLQWLLHEATILLEQTLTNTSPTDAAVPAVLFLVELVIRDVLLEVHGHSAQLLQLLEGNGGRHPTAMGQDSGAALCGVLLDYTVKVPLSLDTAVTHHAVIRLLLTMTSSALHHTTEYSEERIDVFTEMIMSSTILGPFLSVLLQRLNEWGHGLAVDANSGVLLLYAEGQEPGLLNLFGWLGGGSSAAPTKEEEIPAVLHKGPTNTQLLHKSARTGEMIGRLSAELLAVLLAHQKGNGRNPALEYVKAIQSTKELPFGSLLKAIANKLTTCPPLCMVLYVLLHDHPSFLREVIVDAPAVLADAALSVAHLLFIVSTSVSTAEDAGQKGVNGQPPTGSTAITVERNPLSSPMMGNIIAELVQYAYPFIGFMTSSLMLILSEDRVVDELLSDAKRTAAFADKRLPKTLTVGSQIVYALCCGITRAVHEANAALADVLIPALGNISCFVHDMDLQVAQRVLQLVTFLLKRIRWADDAYQPSQQETASDETDPAQVKMMGDVWARQLRGVLESVESMMARAGDRHNESLVYEVLYNMDRLRPQGSFEPAQADSSQVASVAVKGDDSGIDPATKPSPQGAAEHTIGVFESQIQSTVASLHRTVQQCEKEVFSSPNVGNVQEILRIIRHAMSASTTTETEMTEVETGGRAANGVAGMPETQDVELVFTYEESPHSYDFFGPFVWATLLSEARRPGAMLWCTQVCELPLFPQ